ncbi:hypothetical protein FRC01_003139 [Tulasnella sp. 417]|nr:hypothetical protein FRC01_003139 [Tulasnella sp. 417]
MTQAKQMHYPGQAASFTSTLRHKPSSSTRVDTPSTLVAQLSSHDLKGSYANDEKMLLNISGRQSPQSSGLKRPATVRPETPRNMARKESRGLQPSHSAGGLRKAPSQHSMASSLEKNSPRARSARLHGPVGYVARPTVATNAPAVPPEDELDLKIRVRRSKPLPEIDPSKLSPHQPIFADVLSESPYSMASAELPVYSSGEEWSKRRPSARGPIPRSRTPTPTNGSRRQGVFGRPSPYSSSSESDTESIAKSQGSVSSGHTASTDNRSSRYARLLVAIGI